MAPMCSATAICRTWWRTCNRCGHHRRRRRKEHRVQIRNLILTAAWAGILAPASAQVTAERLLRAAREPEQWLTYSGAYNGQRYSPLDQVNRSNIQRLALQWVFQTGVSGSHQAT